MIKEKTKIGVPAGIRYLSDWADFDLRKFPEKCIIDKQIPGCGFTEYCITSPLNIILASPRKKLIKNKYDQHKDDVYLVNIKEEEDLGVDKDLNRSLENNKKNSLFTEDNSEEDLEDSTYSNSNVDENTILENKLSNPLDAKTLSDSFLERLNRILDNNGVLPERENNVYVRIYKEIENYINKMNMYRKPYKILVTYDSYRLVKEILIKLGLFQNFFSVVDEFQSILHDARFKSTTELSFLEYLKQSPTAYFVSATPMLEEYINMLDEFDGLPYFELDWGELDPGRVVKPNLKVLTMKSVGSKAKEIIQKYLNKDFEKIIVTQSDGVLKEIVSDEAVLFMNSVKHIVSIIKKNNLSTDQVTILCSNTKENKNLIKRKLGKKYLDCLTDIPLRGEKPKMFTFCTRTTYLGADFYSTCARTFIFSDSNLDCLAVDISDDLPQILGRQRLDENPWKNSATLFYRLTADYKKMEASEFSKKIEEKKEKTYSLLRSYSDVVKEYDKDTLADAFRDLAKALNYEKNYVAVNEYYTPETGVNIIPVFNNLVHVSELRSFRIALIDYRDRFTMFSRIRRKFGEGVLNREDEGTICNFLNEYESTTTVIGKYKLLCESRLQKETIDAILDQIQDSDIVKSNYLALGPEFLIGVCYNKTKIDEEIRKLVFDKNLLAEKILNEYNVGQVIPSKVLKDKLIEIYRSLGSTRVVSASAILNYFNAKEYPMRINVNGTGEKKLAKVYELLSIKPEYEELYNKLKGI